eukprot:TRINITY_DN367_c0_g1_i1.p2 TRINITY_DN367_c0_g1~~TRINITY_DN367_c0_g1_i1.p2  ORF type:complete len:503 (-),score=58.95 TRINITY_DN367_c0_g1_i1:5245-6753(-)
MDGSPLANFRWYFDREKTLYNTLNMFQAEKTWFKGLCWCPLSKKDEVDDTINLLRSNKKVVCTNLKEIKEHGLTPPTYFRTNDFLRPFQEIVFTYGVPSYKEANPTLFTIITFPFLFGIMFGDFAHGLVLLSISSYVCIRKDYLIRTKSLLAEAVDARYLLLLMGVFSSFCGFLYNDFGAVPLNFIPSCFDKPREEGEVFDRSDPSCVYPIGFDPMWYAASNELQFINSFKMKISVIVGVAQMLIGIILKGMNTLHYKNTIDFLYEFLPQLVFMVAFFGYMNLMIIIKWLTDWSSVGQNGPSIITLLIGIPLKGSDPGPIPLYGDGSLQQTVGMFVLGNFVDQSNIAISAICVPWMLIVKPLLIRMEHENEAKKHPAAIEMQEQSQYKEIGGEEGKVEEKPEEFEILKKKEEKFDFSEVLIHQIIETIEYVLGTISNTASYLRLWALSLAHAQLSKVFFEMTIGNFLFNRNNVNFFLVSFRLLTKGRSSSVMQCLLEQRSVS